jgi:hypothetical protein
MRCKGGGMKKRREFGEVVQINDQDHRVTAASIKADAETGQRR